MVHETDPFANMNTETVVIVEEPVVHHTTTISTFDESEGESVTEEMIAAATEAAEAAAFAINNINEESTVSINTEFEHVIPVIETTEVNTSEGSNLLMRRNSSGDWEVIQDEDERE